MAEPILKVDCDSCKLRTEHAFSKNVKGDFGYVCLKCGREITFGEALEERTKAEFPSDNSLPVGVA